MYIIFVVDQPEVMNKFFRKFLAHSFYANHACLLPKWALRKVSV